MSYSISISKRLEAIGAKEGSRLSVASRGKTFVGTLMPHHEFSGEDIIILKLSSGYNIGIRILEDSDIKVLGQPAPVLKRDILLEKKAGLPNITIIGTGGTISSAADPKTGAMQPQHSSAEFVSGIQEITDIANITVKAAMAIFSENMNADRWKDLAEAVAEEMNNGADGVVIMHGTDTMGYTASALSFMLGDVPKPVVLVGAQRSPDRPSSDAPSNMTAAVRFCAKGGAAGVFVVMHEALGDDSFAVHLGTRARKMHTSRRDAFKSPNTGPFAVMDKDGNTTFKMEGRAVSEGKAAAATKMEKAVTLIQYYPGMDPKLFEDVIMKSKGIVISGTGLGHVGSDMIPLIRKAVAGGTIVVAASQCTEGTTSLNVYSTGREMLSAGVITVQDMLPETAYVKLMWALANSDDTDEAKRLMMTPLANEMSGRRVADV
ncbi:MAG: Glu-tRNA(Gln) amidotransferase subunit GatD [Candidatus Methanoplasma sp.]|jgi:glutamyl-tRNA(Gln) amidotransferase subunit D|nr:Glu-tRNA(Gln) amidotransferase subunit GatD [Candidatus Methanoplasma sp.]